MIHKKINIKYGVFDIKVTNFDKRMIKVSNLILVINGIAKLKTFAYLETALGIHK